MISEACDMMSEWCDTSVFDSIRVRNKNHANMFYLSLVWENAVVTLFNDHDVAADLPLQLTLRVDWRSRSGCALSYDLPTNRDVVYCRTSNDWQRRPWQPLCQGHSRELRLVGSLAIATVRCSSSGTCYLAQYFSPRSTDHLRTGCKLQVCVVRLSQPTTVDYVCLCTM